MAASARRADPVHRARLPPGNGYNESFNGKRRDELLDGELSYMLKEARIRVEQWRVHYNTIRHTARWAIIRRHRRQSIHLSCPHRLRNNERGLSLYRRGRYGGLVTFPGFAAMGKGMSASIASDRFKNALGYRIRMAILALPDLANCLGGTKIDRPEPSGFRRSVNILAPNFRRVIAEPILDLTPVAGERLRNITDRDFVRLAQTTRVQPCLPV